MRRVGRIIAVTGLVLAISCAVHSPVGEPPVASQLESVAACIPYSTLSSGNKGYYKSDQLLTETIYTQAGLNDLWGRLNSNSLGMPQTPQVDFSSSMVIAIVQKTQPSGGYGIRVTSITQNKDILVKYDETSPNGCISTMALTQPYELVMVPKSDKTVTYESTPKDSCN